MTESAATRVSIRWWAEDGQEHVYLAADLAGDWVDAEPVCAPWQSPFPHQRRAVSADDLRALGKVRCPRCAIWTRTNPHEVVVGGKPVAVVLVGNLAVA